MPPGLQGVLNKSKDQCTYSKKTETVKPPLSKSNFSKLNISKASTSKVTTSKATISKSNTLKANTSKSSFKKRLKKTCNKITVNTRKKMIWNRTKPQQTTTSDSLGDVMPANSNVIVKPKPISPAASSSKAPCQTLKTLRVDLTKADTLIAETPKVRRQTKSVS